MKKKFQILILMFIPFFFTECEKEEHVSYSITLDNFQYGTNHLDVRYTVFAPGRVSIEDHGIEYKNTTTSEYNRISFGRLRNAGSYGRFIEGLNPANQYEFWIYSESGGYINRTTSAVFTTLPVFMP